MSRPRRFCYGFLISIVFILIGSLIACERARRGQEVERVWTVSPRDLHNSYLDTSERYTGKSVSIHLSAFSYVVSGNQLHWHGGDPKLHPDIIFTLPEPPLDNTKSLHVDGVCRGKVLLKPVGPNDPRFYVHVEVATVR